MVGGGGTSITCSERVSFSPYERDRGREVKATITAALLFRFPDSANKFKFKELEIMFKNFLLDETGAELAEYAVAVALLVAIGLVVYATLGNGINDANSGTADKIKTAEFTPAS